MIAQPMRWVKLTLPPRVRAMWLLITIRLSIMSFAGTVRTLVAVGTVSDSSMLAARVLVMPRRTVTWFSSVDASPVEGTAAGACAGIGWFAAGLAVVRATGCAPTTGIGAVIGRASDAAAPPCGGAAVAGAGAVASGAAPPAGWYVSRIGHHALSTEFLS